MMRPTTIVSFFLLLLLPLEAGAFWFGDEGQCFADTALGADATQADWQEMTVDSGCESGDPTDPSSNACFEGAEHPISTLPELITQTQAEQLVGDMLAGVVERAAAASPQVDLSTEHASIEDPHLPGQPLIERPSFPRPRPEPNACSVYPESCEKAPWIPILNLEASGPQARDAQAHLDIEPAPEPEHQLGLPNDGLTAANGVSRRVERPPQMT